MDPKSKEAIEQAIADMRNGKSDAENRFWCLVEPELKRIAQNYMKGERLGHTLQATAVGFTELWLKMREQGAAKDPRNAACFFAVAAKIMRHILVDSARTHNAAKRRPPGERVALDDIVVRFDGRDIASLDLDAALGELERLHPRPYRVIELRLADYELKEIAELLEVALSTVEGDQRFARAWLKPRLEPPG